MKDRQFIYAKDISIVTGRGPRYAQRILRNIKHLLKKENHQLVTLQEFAAYMGIELSLVQQVCR